MILGESVKACVNGVHRIYEQYRGKATRSPYTMLSFNQFFINEGLLC